MIQVFRPRYEVEDCLKEIREVLESGWSGTGPKCKKLEKQWESFVGTPSLFVNSATAGLHLAMRTVGILPATEAPRVATTPITFVSTNAVIVYEGFEPFFCDIDPETMTISREALTDALEADVSALIWVHYAGNVVPWFDEVPGLGIPVIEDCAHAAGSFYASGKRVGSREDTISVFSYQAVKNMPTFDSGMFCTANKAIMERARKLSWLGIDKNTFERSVNDGLYKWKYLVDELGWKYNGNDIAAAIGLAQLKVLDRDNSYRRQIYRWYRDNLDGSKARLLPHSDGSSVHFCAIEVNNRDELLGELKLNEIAPGVHYLPNFMFPAFNNYYKKGQCPNAERMAERVLTLPTHLMLTKDDVDKISEIVVKSAV